MEMHQVIRKWGEKTSNLLSAKEWKKLYEGLANYVIDPSTQVVPETRFERSWEYLLRSKISGKEIVDFLLNKRITANLSGDYFNRRYENLFDKTTTKLPQELHPSWEGDDVNNLADFWRRAERFYRKAGNLNKAENAALRAMLLYGRLTNYGRISEMLEKKAHRLHEQGMDREALEYRKKSLDFALLANPKDEHWNRRMGLANALRDTGEFEEAFKLYKEIAKRAGGNINFKGGSKQWSAWKQSSFEGNVGMLAFFWYLKQGKRAKIGKKEAVKRFQNAVDILNKASQKQADDEKIRWMLFLARVTLDLGIVEKVDTIVKETGSLRNEARALRVRSEILTEKKKNKEALKVTEEALKKAVITGDLLAQQELLFQKANLQRRLKYEKEAEITESYAKAYQFIINVRKH
jgi:hypothetical protein